MKSGVFPWNWSFSQWFSHEKPAEVGPHRLQIAVPHGFDGGGLQDVQLLEKRRGTADAVAIELVVEYAIFYDLYG